MNRRHFIYSAAVASMGALGARVKAATGSGGKPMTAAIIGHSGRGNYGHGLEQVFSDRPGIEIVGLADADAVGRAKTQERVRARRVYSDYQEMLAKERPQLVSVAPRWTDQHYAMVSAALAVGAHVYCEKPFTRTLADADALLAVARKSGLKIAVAHQARLAPQTLLLKQKIADGLVGELLEIRVHGKQDKRAGGEDLLVLGTHQFDLVRFFAGDAHGCSARILQQDREVTLAEVREGTEDIGPIIGDEIEAQFALSHGVNVHYTSRAKNAAVAGPWGMEFVGTRGRVRLLNDVHTLVYVLQPGLTKHLGASQAWVPLASAPGGAVVAAGGMVTANRVVVDDWLAAIAADREPVCSGYAAMKSLEMIHAIFAAGLSRGRVELPLRNRQHPLSI